MTKKRLPPPPQWYEPKLEAQLGDWVTWANTLPTLEEVVSRTIPEPRPLAQFAAVFDELDLPPVPDERDYLIMRLLRAGSKAQTRGELLGRPDFVKSIAYMYERLGERMFNTIIDELDDEQRRKEWK